MIGDDDSAIDLDDHDPASLAQLMGIAESEGISWPDSDADDVTLATTIPSIRGYEVIARLGSGGMGTVWRAKQLAGRREVALKLMHAASLGSATARARFEREVELTARLDHPNIVRLYDSGIHDGVCFFAMELIDGEPLDRYCETTPTRKTLTLMSTVCRAVQYAHQRGVIHRDLKPSNILVDKEGEPHVLDFGLAKPFLGDASELAVSQDGAAPGTLAYMSPEQAAGGASLDTRSDVYSLGVILYQLVTGHFPHDLSGSYLQVLARISSAEVISPQQASAELDGELETVLLKAMARNPDERYASAGELADDIGRYLSGDPLSARPPTLAYFVARRGRQYRTAISIGMIVAMALAGMAIYAYARVKRERNVAVAQRLRADAAAGSALTNQRRADAERDHAEQQRRSAESNLADSLVAQGDALAQAERWPEAKGRYEEARRKLLALGRPAFAAESGLMAAYGPAPPPLNVFTAHNGAVTAATFSQDGRFALSGSDDRTVRLWDLQTAQEIRAFTGHSSTITRVAISPDGTSVMAAGDDGSIHLWDSATGRTIHTFGHDRRVFDLCYSPDGTRAASASWDGSCKIWNLASGQCVCSFVGHQPGAATSVCFTPDGKKCLSTGVDGAVLFWDSASGRLIRSVGGIGTALNSVALSSDGGFALTGASVPTTLLTTFQDPNLGRALGLWTLGFPINSGAIPTSDPVLPGPQPVRWLAGHISDVVRVGFSDDGRVGVSAGNDGSFRVWDIAAGRQVRAVWRTGEPVNGIAFSRDGQLALSGANAGSSDHEMKLWDLGQSRSPIIADHAGQITALAVSPDAQTIFTVTPHCQVRALDATTAYDVSLHPPKAENSGQAIAVSPDGRLLLEGRIAEVRLWDLDRREQTTLGQHADSVRAVAFSADGRFALSHSGNQIIWWDLAHRRALRTIRSNRVLVSTIAFSADSARALSASTHGAIMIFDLKTGDWLPNFGNFNEQIELSSNVAFLSTGPRAVALAGSGNAVVFWNPFTGVRLFELTGHTGRVNAVAVSPDGRLVASAGNDRTVRVWDVAERREVRALGGYEIAAICLAFGPDGRRLFTGGFDGTLRIWDLTLPAAYRDWEPRLDAARKALRLDPQDAKALAEVGEWYAFRGRWGWAVELLERARAEGAEVSSDTLARCYWSLGNLPAANKEYAAMPYVSGASNPYLRLRRRGSAPNPEAWKEVLATQP